MKQNGFTILELMIALVVGAFLLAGVMFTYLSMKTTTSDTLDIGELQETGRIAMDILGKDLEMAGFWGTYNLAALSFSSLTNVPNSPANDCSMGSNDASFPQASPSNFKHLFGVEATNAAVLGCINNAKVGSDVVQIKRLSGNDINNTATATNANNYYFESNYSSGQIFQGNGAVYVSPNINGSAWQYNHHVYYISEQNYTKDGKNITVPTLMRKRLTASGGMETESVLDGVENIRFLYGMDTNGDHLVDTYKTASQMTASDWEQVNAKILTVQLFVLVRSVEPDQNSTKVNNTYVLGGGASAPRTLNFGDNYRRMLFVSTVKVKNAEGESW